MHEENVAVSRRVVATATVRVATVTRTRDEVVDEALTQQRADIRHVPVGRYVDAVPPMRQEGDVTVIPVVDEVLVIERRLLLREEVHVRRVRTTKRHTQTVQLRGQDAVITRTPAPGRDGTDPQHPSKETEG